jgi:hypothetical protein
VKKPLIWGNSTSALHRICYKLTEDIPEQNMNKRTKITVVGIMAIAMAAMVAAVSPQLFAAEQPAGEVGQSANVAAIAAPQTDVVDAYNWRTTISPGRNKSGI